MSAETPQERSLRWERDRRDREREGLRQEVIEELERVSESPNSGAAKALRYIEQLTQELHTKSTELQNVGRRITELEALVQNCPICCEIADDAVLSTSREET